MANPKDNILNMMGPKRRKWALECPNDYPVTYAEIVDDKIEEKAGCLMNLVEDSIAQSTDSVDNEAWRAVWRHLRELTVRG